MANEFDKERTDIYSDDGSVCLKNLNSRQVDCVRKHLIKIFKNYGLKVEVGSDSNKTF